MVWSLLKAPRNPRIKNQAKFEREPFMIPHPASGGPFHDIIADQFHTRQDRDDTQIGTDVNRRGSKK